MKTHNDIMQTMPTLFVGHGSPMNAIEENRFVDGFRTIAQQIPQPRAILCISAHWQTIGSRVTAMEHPRTIHDFGGFPAQLFAVQYPAPGNPQLASEIVNTLKHEAVDLDHSWGLDHGTWSVIKHLYPKANIPVLQLSLDYKKTPQQHFEFAQQLHFLRQQGVLIIASGNIVHNLGMIAWDAFDRVDYAHEWAREVQNKVNAAILNNDIQSIVSFEKWGRIAQLAMPTPEHYLPLIYIMALKKAQESVQIFNDEAVAGSLTMTSVLVS